MDEGAKSLILKGCKMAADLQLRLMSLVDRPDTVASTCKEIARAFHGARERMAGAPSFGDGQAYCKGVQLPDEHRATAADISVRSVSAGVVGRIMGMAVSSDNSRGSASSSHGEPTRYGYSK